MKTMRYVAVLAALALAAGVWAGPGQTGITQKSDQIEDTAVVSGEYGCFMLAQRVDAGGSTCGATGEYCGLTLDATGNLYVTVGAGVAGAGSAVVEDAAHVGGEDGTGGMCRRIDVLATSAGASGDWATCNQDASGAQWVHISAIDAGANNIGDVDVLTLPALVAGAANIGDVDVLTLPALPAGANNIGDVDVLTLPALVAGVANIGDVDVLTLPALPAGANNIGDVDVLTLPALPAGANNIGDVDVLTLPALVAGAANIGDVDVLTLPALPAGANNIGDVDVLTLPALVAGAANIGDVDVLTLPALIASTANIGDVDVEILGTAATVDAELAAQGADFDIEAATANLRLRCIVWNIGADATSIWTIRHNVIAAAECDGNALLYIQGLAAASTGQFCYGTSGLGVASGLCADESAGAATLSVTAMLATEAAP